MSGFFHRLAGQAIGRGAAVRAAARLPYMPPPPLPEQPPEEMNTAVSADQPPAAVAPSPQPAALFSNPPTETRADALAALTEISQHPAAIAGPRAESGTRPGGPQMAHRPRPPAAAGADTAPDPLPIMPPEQGMELFSDNHVEPRRASAVMPLAAPLLPPQHPMRPIGLEKRHPEPQRIDRGAPVDEATEVHVSIGRIEVTAVHEAPPAPQRQPPRTKPMSLEQYLARRRGGGS